MQIRIDTLKAARQFCATKDIRYYLVGVRVCNGRVEATDGYIAFRADEPGAEGDFIIPLDLLDAALKNAKKATMMEITLVDGRLSLTAGAATVTGAPIDGTFPDIGRVIPETVSGELAQYNPEMISRAYKGLGLYYNAKPECFRLEHNGDKPAVLWYPPASGALALVMPLRAESPAPEELTARLAAMKK